MQTFLNFVARHPDLDDQGSVCMRYASAGLTVIPGPDDARVSELIVAALTSATPFSVVRIGDGESNLLTYGDHPETPTLDSGAAQQIMLAQKICPAMTDDTLTTLKALMHEAIARADIVGPRGVGRPSKRARRTPEETRAFFDIEPRGVSGIYRGTEACLQLAERGALRDHVITSAYLYIGVGLNIGRIIPAARRVICVTDKAQAITNLQRRFPAVEVEHNDLSALVTDLDGLPIEKILAGLMAPLEGDLRGALCLIGAGPWSEPLCSQIKARGGVAVDVGSLFDLWSGITSRPIHKGVLKTWPELLGSGGSPV